MNAVERIHSDLADVSRLVLEAGQPSYASTIGGIQAKALLLAAASEFESDLTAIVLEFCQERFPYRSIIPEIVQKKAITRQYHTWFQWDGRNANSFFSLFGQDFKQFAAGVVNEDDELQDSVANFLKLGAERNLLVHKDFARFTLTSTADEVFERYQKARLFIGRVKKLLETFEDKQAGGGES